jgi:hypothetical protein
MPTTIRWRYPAIGQTNLLTVRFNRGYAAMKSPDLAVS